MNGYISLHLLDLGGDISGNGLSKLFLTIAAAFAEAERDRIRERVGQVKADQKGARPLSRRHPAVWLPSRSREFLLNACQKVRLTRADQPRNDNQPARLHDRAYLADQGTLMLGLIVTNPMKRTRQPEPRLRGAVPASSCQPR